MRKALYYTDKKVFQFGKRIRNFQFSGFVNYLMKYKEVPFPEI